MTGLEIWCVLRKVGAYLVVVVVWLVGVVVIAEKYLTEKYTNR